MPMMRAVKVAVRLALFAVLLGALVVHADRSSAVLPGENGKIAFASARAGNFEVFVVNPDATGQARLTNDPSTDSDPRGRRTALGSRSRARETGTTRST